MKHVLPQQLYIVATPIGNLGDFTTRAQQILQQVDLIVAEDTRHSRKLLQHFGIQTAMQSLHEHNEQERIAGLLERLERGEAIAMISDAGTPLVSDPGYKVVNAVWEAGFEVVPIPGACAAIAALSAVGMPSDKFLFVGFMPATANKRKAKLQELIQQTATLIFYESPHRILSLLDDMQQVFGDRLCAVARELTKTHETVLRGALSDITKTMREDPNQTRGEFVVMLHGAEATAATADEQDIDMVLTALLAELPLKQAVKIAVNITNGKKNDLYARAIALQQK